MANRNHDKCDQQIAYRIEELSHTNTSLAVHRQRSGMEDEDIVTQGYGHP